MGESNTMYNHGFRKYVLIETFLKLLKYIEQIDTQVGTTCQYQKELAWKLTKKNETKNVVIWICLDARMRISNALEKKVLLLNFFWTNLFINFRA